MAREPDEPGAPSRLKSLAARSLAVVAPRIRYLVAVVLLSATVSGAWAYSSGPGGCDLNGASAHSSSSGAGAWTITTGSPVYQPGGSGVSISINGDVNFKGLLVYGTRPDGTRVGTFNTPSGMMIISGCSGDPSSTVGHDSATLKNQPFVLTWTPGPSTAGTITFQAAVVVDFNTWYIAATATIPELIPGDADFDGDIDDDDVSLIVSYVLAGGTPYYWAADCNGDLKLSVADVVCAIDAKGSP